MTSPRRGGGLKGFRLEDIPEPILQRGKAVAIRREENPLERLRIGLVADYPAQYPKVHYVPREAWERVMGPRP